VSHPVKALFEVQVHPPLLAFRPIRLGAGNCLMRGAVWAKARALCRAGWGPRPLQAWQQGLLAEAVQDGGEPEVASPPPGWGISTRLTGLGWEVPAKRDARSAGQWGRKYPGSPSTGRPAIPGLPPFVFTRANAAKSFLRSTTPAITRASVTGVCPLAAPTDALPLWSAQGSVSCVSGAVRRSSLSRSLLPSGRAYGPRVAGLLGLLLTPPLG
jgi:hypothetical protein